jgi:hypothetical protein
MNIIKKKGLIMRKGQVTLFIIMGVVVLILLVLVGYVKQIGEPREDLEKIYLVTNSIIPVKSYVEKCLKDIGNEAMLEVAYHGGKIDPENSEYLNNEKINYYCTHEPGDGCKNTLIFRSDIENEIAQEINNKIKTCVDLDIFRNQGFVVEASNAKTNVQIEEDSITFSLDYPIKLEKESIALSIDSFATNTKSELGFILRISNQILNSEIQKQNFKIVEFMQQHNVIIEKFRPYPNIIYRITKKQFVFQFALKGEDTISELGYSFYGVSNNKGGCCYNPEDNFCFKNSNKQECQEKQGFYTDAPCDCPAQTFFDKDTLNIGLDCKNTYNRIENNYLGEDKLNGESWCSYKTQPGQGIELVGSRHFVHYCLNGKEYVEPCRDYREEVCVEKKDQDSSGNIYSNAQCRPNRWEDCIKCETQDCCEDSSVRDCTWQYLSTDKKCTPAVSPGFKFWQPTAVPICTRANEKKECSGLSCGQEWVDDTTTLCYTQGDCGNYKNTKQVLTKYGFITSDFKYKPSSEAYNKGNYYDNNEETENKLVYEATNRATLTPFTYGEAINSNAELVSASLEYIDKISSLSATDFINPFKDKPAIYVLGISLCGPWMPPRTIQNCESCTANKFKPCSEYSCKSLGQTCVYDYNFGDPTCQQQKSDDKTPPIVNLDNEALTPGYDLYPVTITTGTKIIKGHKILPEVDPNAPFSLGIKSNEPVTCKLTLMPFKNFNDVTGIYLGGQSFSKTQNISLRTPPKIAIPENIMDILNFTHYKEIADVMEEPEELMNTYKEKYKTAINLYNMFASKDIEDKVDPIVEKAKEIISNYKSNLPYIKTMISVSLDKLENNTYLLFVRCVDESGNENAETKFIEIPISSNTEDNLAPSIIGFSPTNNSKIQKETYEEPLTIYLNEPSECRYDFYDLDFEKMDYEFECDTGQYQVSSSFGGTYECATTLFTLDDPTTAYIKCQDQPFQVKEYFFYLEETNTNGISELTSNEFFNFTLPNKIYSSLSMFEEDHITFQLDTSKSNGEEEEEMDNNIKNKVELHLFKDSPDSCQFSFGTYSGELNNCKKTNELHLGTYECITEIDLNQGKQEKTYFIETEEVTVVEEKVEFNMKNVEGIPGNQITLPETNQLIELSLKFEQPQVCFQLDKSTPAQEQPMICQEETCFKQILPKKTSAVKCYERNLKHNLTFQCATNQIEQQNVNEQSFVYTLSKSAGFEIIETQPEGEVNTASTQLIIKTTKADIKCRYKKEFSISYIDMIKQENNNDDNSNDNTEINTFIANVADLDENLNNFHVKCVDNYGNSAETDIEFYVI